MPYFTLLMVLWLALAAPAVAAGTSDRKANAPSRWGYEHADHNELPRFSSADRNLIRSWLREAERREAAGQPAAGLPSGLQKKVASGTGLPPGWQTKLSRGTLLDHSYYRRGVMLPDELLRRLSPRPVGAEILRIDDQILLLDAGTRTIFDIFALGGH